MKTIITNSSTISSTALCEDQTPHTIRKSAGTAVITLQGEKESTSREKEAATQVSSLQGEEESTLQEREPVTG